MFTREGYQYFSSCVVTALEHQIRLLLPNIILVPILEELSFFLLLLNIYIYIFHFSFKHIKPEIQHPDQNNNLVKVVSFIQLFFELGTTCSSLLLRVLVLVLLLRNLYQCNEPLRLGNVSAAAVSTSVASPVTICCCPEGMPFSDE